METAFTFIVIMVALGMMISFRIKKEARANNIRRIRHAGKRK